MISVAIILSFMALISMTEVRQFVPWAANISGLIVAAIVCAILLVLMSPRAAWLMGIASTLSIFFFAACWTYSTWALVGAVFSLADLVTSNLLILYLFPRSLILFIASILCGVLTVFSAQFLLPDFEAADERNPLVRSSDQQDREDGQR